MSDSPRPIQPLDGVIEHRQAVGAGSTVRSSPWLIRLGLLSAASLVYIALPYVQDERRPVGRFMQLGESFLRGSATITVEPTGNPTIDRLHTNELIPTRDPSQFYCPYPPLPAVFMIPFAIVGWTLSSAWLCRIICIIDVLIFDACVVGLFPRLGFGRLGNAPRIAFNLAFAFGTVVWHNAEMGGDWHLAHAIGVMFLLLSLREFLSRGRPLVIGALVALAMCARPTSGLTALFFAFAVAVDIRSRRRRIADLAQLAIGPLAATTVLAFYNLTRFGNPLDFGYGRMILIGAGERALAQYGQFSTHFIPINLYWFFLAPPALLPDGRPPFLGYDPHGLSLFIASPIALYAVVAVARRWSLPLVRAATIGITGCLVPLLMYFNTGYWQFGHRFSMDYLPMLMVLIIAGIGPRPGRFAYAWIALSILIQGIAVIVDPVVLSGTLASALS